MDLKAVRQISGKARLVMITILLTILLTLAPALPETRTVEAVSLQEDQADAVLSHLQAVLEDLAFMEELLSDQQLGLFAGSDDDSELTAWQMQDMAELARQHRQKVDQALLAAENRQAPDLQPLQQCRTAKLAMLALAADMLDEYEQVMLYSINLMAVGDDLSNLPEYDELDEAAYYEASGQALLRSAELLDSIPVPSYLQIMNERLVDILLQMNDAVYYSYYAVMLNDPVRLSASDYHMDIIMRRFSGIMADLDHDVASRQEKLAEDANEVERVYRGITSWAQDNIRRLRR